MDKQITTNDWNALNECLDKFNKLNKLKFNTIKEKKIRVEKVTEMNDSVKETISTIIDKTGNLTQILQKYLDEFNSKNDNNKLYLI